MSDCCSRPIQGFPATLLSALLIVSCLSIEARAQVPTFEQAFEREASELRVTKTALQKAFDELDRDTADRKAKLEADIQRTEASILALQRRSRELSAARDFASEASQVTDDHSAVLEALLTSAQKRLSTRGERVDVTGEDVAASFTAVVDAAVKVMERSGRPHLVDGAFFDSDGVQVHGKLIHIGDVAAFGVAPSAGGLLTRTSSGYRVLDPASRGDAEALIEGPLPETLDVFLLSPDCTGHRPNEDRGLIATANKGGPVAWIILALAALGLLLVCERVWTLGRHSGLRGPSFDDVAVSLRSLDFTAASGLAVRMGVVGSAIRSVIDHRELPREEIEKRASELILKTMPMLERSLTILVVITAVAPLLGLLGTVTGMISTFDVITEFGTGDPKLLSGGISEALITTEFGLAVAVPLLLVRSLIARWSDRLIENMQTYALATMNLLGRAESSDER